MTKSFLVTHLSLTLGALLVIAVWMSEASQVEVTLENLCGRSVALHWMDQSTKQRTHIENIAPEQRFHYASSVGHEFQVEELPLNSSTSDCLRNADRKCRTTTFSVTDSQNHTRRIEPGLKISRARVESVLSVPSNSQKQEDSFTQFERCRLEAKKRLLKAGKNSKETIAAFEKWKTCEESSLVDRLQEAEEHILSHASVRQELSYLLENYTCVDPDLETSPYLEQRDWTSKRDGKTRLVNVHLDRPASRIHVVEDFANEEECNAMEAKAEPDLQRAVVQDGRGGWRFSSARKAMQRGIIPNWSQEAEGDPIASLSRRVYDYVNHVLDLNLTEHGQEPLMSIQYFGRGYEDEDPDRYQPHCDAPCDGTQHRHGTRMATMVIYCTVPERGGHTNFQNAAVHVKPSVGNAVFFSYMDPETKQMDTGLTSHSGCPVYEGQKKIVTQWIRYGVDANNPHSDLNSLGIKKSETIH